MTSVRFIGDIALWQASLLAAALAALAWWLYWRESRSLQGAARWVLPTLRAAAIVLAILVLCAPVLHHRYREGQPGRLRFLVDASRSMSITDRHLAESDKLAIAQSLGWVAGAAPQSTEAAGSQTAEALKEFDRASRLERAFERLLSAQGGVLSQVSDEFEVIVERFDRERTSLWESTLTAQPQLPANRKAWVPADHVAATAIGTALASGAVKLAQSGTPDAAGTSDAATTEAVPQSSEETLVLLTDGRNTVGPSPLTLAEDLAAQRRPVFVIGYGGTQPPEDVSLVTIEHPERVFQRDMLRGTLVVRDGMQQRSPLRMKIELDGEVVWEETRTLTTGERGRIDFSFAVKPLVEKIQQQAARNTGYTAVPLHLRATIESQDREADVSNNSRMFHVSVVTKRSRLLLVDGRSRWETRYLHNMFERDPAWQVDIVLPDYRQNPPTVPSGTADNQWPSTKEKLMEYDLVILGELPAASLPRDGLVWLKSFVEDSGGGLIVVDGQRGWLRDTAYQALHALLPIEWLDEGRPAAEPVGIHLTSAAQSLAAFQLTPQDPGKNGAAWAELPQVHTVTAVKSLPGSEVLATYTQEKTEVPLMVTRQFGAGRVFYVGTDETWRWRYKVADTYHQRFWNQIARWVMRLPMSVQGQFVAIDSGKLVYQPGEAMVIRSRLRDAQGQPAKDLTVEAIIRQARTDQSDSQPANEAATAASDSRAQRQGQVVAVVPLAADAAIAGLYSGQITAPRSGDYQVSIVAPGLASEALEVHSEFSVADLDSGEMDQLNCDQALLQKLAESTKGAYLSEERGDELVELLRPLSRGKIMESDTLIWQSYWWFVPIVLLLASEWWIRKRVGLL